jgi:hypothetical protein
MLSLLLFAQLQSSATSSSNEYWIELLNLVGRQVVYLVYKVSKGIASLILQKHHLQNLKAKTWRYSFVFIASF